MRKTLAILVVGFGAVGFGIAPALAGGGCGSGLGYADGGHGDYVTTASQTPLPITTQTAQTPTTAK